jgi:hypothetical protein
MVTMRFVLSRDSHSDRREPDLTRIAARVSRGEAVRAF